MEEPESFDALPIEERLCHKVWKARVSAYEELTKQFRSTASEDDPIFSLYSRDDTLKKAVLDSNAVAQEKGVECAAAFVEFGGKQTAATRPDVVPALVDKCLGSTRAGTKTKAIELCLLYIETEGSSAGVVTSVFEGLKAKQPKTVTATVSVLKESVKQFGVKIVDIKPVLKQLPLIFGHTDKNVRAEGVQLVNEIYRFIGPTIETFLSELKPVQIKELNAGFQALESAGNGKNTGLQSRLTRDQVREKAVKEAEQTLSGLSSAQPITDDADVEDAGDELDLLDPVDILPKIPADFYEKLSSSKWKERKEEALDPLLTIVSVPKISDRGDLSDLLKALAGRMTDANIACVIAAAHCITAVAKGLRQGFGRYLSLVVAPLLERLKEKKQSVVDALAACLDAAVEHVQIQEFLEDAATFAKHKNPSVKSETYRWLVRFLSTTRKAPTAADSKALVGILLPGLEDGFEPVRAAAQEGMGTLMKIVGERAMNPYLENMDDLRKAKVQEYFAKAQVSCKAGPAVAVAKSKAAPLTETKPVAVQRKPPAHLLPKEPLEPSKPSPPTKPAAAPAPNKAPTVVPKASISVSKTKPAAAAKPPIAASSKAVEPLKYKYSSEDAETQIEALVPASITAELSSSNWKARLAAMEELQTWCTVDGADVDCELICRLLAKRPGWKDSNFQVFAKMFGLAQFLAETSPLWTKSGAAIFIPPATDKLGDLKLKKPASDLLTSIAEKSSLQFVLSQAYEPMTKQKAPKAQADALAWIEQSLKDFGIAGLALRDLIEFLKSGLKSTNAAVKSSASKTLVTLKIFVGPSVKDFIQDLNPTLLTSIEQDFAKVEAESPPEPTRYAADLAVPTSTGAKSQAAHPDALDELHPRVDISRLITPAMLSACSDASFKVRKEAMEQIQSILEANKRLKPSIGDMATVLRLRLSDNNKAVQHIALDVIGRLAEGMEKPFDRFAKSLAPAVLATLSDQKAPTRALGINTLTKIRTAAGLESLVSSIAVSLEAPNPVLRGELLAWLEDSLAKNGADIDLSPMKTSILTCLEDRTPTVRRHANAILPAVLSSTGYEALIQETNNMKPASRSVVIPLIESAKSMARAASQIKAPPESNASAQRPNAAMSRPLSKPAAQSPKSSRPPSTISHVTSDSGPAVADKSIAPQTVVPLAPPFRSADNKMKAARASKEAGLLRWSIEGLPRPEQVEHLRQQMLSQTSEDLMLLLFSPSQNVEDDYIEGLDLLRGCTNGTAQLLLRYKLTRDEMSNRVTANVDLIFKYASIRMADSSETISRMCLDILQDAFRMLANHGHHLSDYEAGCCIPSVIGQLNNPSDLIFAQAQAMLLSLSIVYPASKTFASVFDIGVSSRSARCRAGSLDILYQYIQKHGSRICQPNLLIPAIVPSIQDKDNAVRQKAIDIIRLLQTLASSELDRIVISLPPADQNVLNSALGRIVVEENTSKPVTVQPRAANAVLQPQSNGTRSTAPNGTTKVSSSTTSINSIVRELKLPEVTSTVEGESVDALKRLQKAIAQQPAELLQLSDDIITAISTQMHQAFGPLDGETLPNQLRLCKHLVQSLTAFFDNMTLGRAVSRDVLIMLMAELTQRLLETSNAPGIEAMASLGKVLNMVLIRIFHNSDRSASFGALFILLEDVTINLRELQGQQLTERSKYAELIMKCLWKMSKTAKESLQEKLVDVHKLLVDIDNFLTSIPPAEWRRRASENIPLGDMPLRTCKTILQQIVVVYGQSIIDELESMQMNDGSFTGAYLNRFAAQMQAQEEVHSPGLPISPPLQTLKAKPSFAGPSSVRQSIASQTTTISHRSSQASVKSGQSDKPIMDEREINKHLKEIFDTIGQPETSKQGITALYEFRQANPNAEARIQSWIEATGRHFQTFLERAMANVATERGQASPQPARSPVVARELARPTSSSTAATAATGNDQLSKLHGLFGYSGNL